MLSELKTKSKVIGVKQSLKAVRAGRAERVYFAGDADPALLAPIQAQCESDGIRITSVESMAVLGQVCGIEVGAAVAVLLKEETICPR